MVRAPTHSAYTNEQFLQKTLLLARKVARRLYIKKVIRLGRGKKGLRREVGKRRSMADTPKVPADGDISRY